MNRSKAPQHSNDFPLLCSALLCSALLLLLSWDFLRKYLRRRRGQIQTVLGLARQEFPPLEALAALRDVWAHAGPAQILDCDCE